MRKIMCITMAVMLWMIALPAFAAESIAPVEASEQAEFDAIGFMETVARENTAKMCEFGADSAMIALYTSSEDMAERTSAISKTDFDTATVHILSGTVIDYVLSNAIGDEAAFTEAQTELLAERLNANVIVTQCNAGAGSEWLATTSIMFSQMAYYRPEFPDMEYIVILETETEYSSATVFYTVGEEGIVQSITQPIKTDSISSLAEMLQQANWIMETK